MTNNDYRTAIAKELFSSTHHLSEAYYAVYDALVARANVEFPPYNGVDPVGQTTIGHENVLVSAQILRQDPGLTLNEAAIELNSRTAHEYSTDQATYLTLVAVHLMLLLDGSAQKKLRYTWLHNQRYLDFVSCCFPKATRPSERVDRALEARNSMKAWKLKEKCGIAFVGTDNLARHLELDMDGLTLYVFHHTSFLSTQQSLAGINGDNDWESNLKRGSLPPRLIAETLHSIKDILFTLNDTKSSKILSRLIQQEGFDPDCAELGPVMFNRTPKLEYVYWGERMAALHELRKNRRPRTRFEKWMKCQTTESNALFVALAALLISILVGILSLGLGAVQVWIAWKAWKEPVQEDSEMVIKVEDLIEWIRDQNRR